MVGGSGGTTGETSSRAIFAEELGEESPGGGRIAHGADETVAAVERG